MTQPTTHFALPSWLRVKNETPPVQAALVAVPLMAFGAALVGFWWWRHRERSPAAEWMDHLAAGIELDADRHELAAFIRDTLIGLNKAGIRRLLGPPNAAGEAGVVVAHPQPVSQNVADRWYYRLDRLPPSDRSGGTAIVVAFDERDRAVDARFILPPS